MHFWILQTAWNQLSMCPLKKKHVLFSINRYLAHPLTRVFLNFVIFCLGQTFFKGAYVLCFVCVWKRMVFFSFQCALLFFTGLLLWNLYNQQSHSFKDTINPLQLFIFTNVICCSRLPLWIGCFIYFKFARISLIVIVISLVQLKKQIG